MPDASASGYRAGLRLARLSFCDCTEREPVAAEVVVSEDIVGTEVDAPRVVRAVRIEGRGPVDAGPRIVKIRAAPVACGWKEDTIAIGTRYLSSVHSILGSPCPGAFGP